MELEIKTMKSTERIFNQRPACYKATQGDINRYKQFLENNLAVIKVNNNLLTCEELKCEDHYIEKSELLHRIVEACLDAEDVTIPKTAN